MEVNNKVSTHKTDFHTTYFFFLNFVWLQNNIHDALTLLIIIPSITMTLKYEIIKSSIHYLQQDRVTDAIFPHTIIQHKVLNYQIHNSEETSYFQVDLQTNRQIVAECFVIYTVLHIYQRGSSLLRHGKMYDESSVALQTP